MTELEKILRKELFRRSLYDFVRYFWHCCDPAPFVDGAIVQFFCETFQYFCRDWVGYTEIPIDVPEISDAVDVIDVRQAKKNLNINMPPRHSKSMIFNVMGPTWLWLFYPITAVTVSHTTGLASDANSKRAKLIHSDEFQELYGDIIHLTSESRNACKTEEGGDLRSQARESFTGFGADIIINDDLTNAETARRDQAEMLSAWSYFQNTMPSRINNLDKMLIMNIQQRLAPNDITGHILADAKLSARYTHIVIPAIFLKDTYVVCPISGRIIHYKKGDTLWPERFGDYEALKDQVGNAVFETQYMQNPIASDKTVFKADMLVEKPITEVPSIEAADMIYASHDFPVKDKDTSDFLGSTLAYRIGSTLYIIDSLEKRMAYTKSLEYVEQLDTMFPGSIQIIEDKANGSPIIQQTQESIPGIQAFQPGTASKFQRAESASLYCVSGNVVLVQNQFNEMTNRYELKPSLQNLKTRLLAFPFVEHDDIVDSFTQLILFVFMDKKNQVYGRAFNNDNVVNSSIIIENSKSKLPRTTFFNKEGDTWKALEIAVKYGLETTLIVTREISFKASVDTAIKTLREFAPTRHTYIDASATDGMRGYSNKEFTVVHYEIQDFDKSVSMANLAFSKNRILIDSSCKRTIADIENFKYHKSKDENVKYATTKDGFVACLRLALQYYGSIV